MEEIRDGMEALGFKRLKWVGIGYEHAEAWRIGRMCVWDVHPSNVVLAESGIIVPIDVIITPLPGGFPPVISIQENQDTEILSGSGREQRAGCFSMGEDVIRGTAARDTGGGAEEDHGAHGHGAAGSADGIR